MKKTRKSFKKNETQTEEKVMPESNGQRPFLHISAQDFVTAWIGNESVKAVSETLEMPVDVVEKRAKYYRRKSVRLPIREGEGSATRKKRFDPDALNDLIPFDEQLSASEMPTKREKKVSV